MPLALEIYSGVSAIAIDLNTPASKKLLAMKSSCWLGKVLSETRDLCFPCLMETSILYLVVLLPQTTSVLLEPSLSTASLAPMGAAAVPHSPTNAQLPLCPQSSCVSPELQGWLGCSIPSPGTAMVQELPGMAPCCHLLSNTQPASPPQTLSNYPVPEGTSFQSAAVATPAGLCSPVALQHFPALCLTLTQLTGKCPTLSARPHCCFTALKRAE